ncbi:CD83 antigen-like isoform X1 [Chiloscyllium plagiosum]|uniref:CD83 antigen-like isoform X1 n=1 Tax=Chiloscyllium plagiosum TaxID=36176 RepID=UPI001CB8341A|nr:CD83 antigen-like isoform X1 [Chiloscyllium plagiosum]
MRWREAELIHQWLVVFLLYLRPVGTGELPSVAARCTQTATLPCTARRQVMQSYRAVSWYKVGEATLSGIIRKAGNEMIRYKHFNGNAMITENDSLVIARVTEDDAGIYRCSLLAPLGGMNQDGDVTLSVCLPLDPVTEPAVTSLRRTATASLLHSRSGACICVPVILSFITCLSFVAVITMVKGLACYCTVWVFRKMRRPNQENPEAGGKVEEHLVQSLREHIQRVSLEKDQRSVRVRSQLDGSVHCVWAVGHV